MRLLADPVDPFDLYDACELNGPIGVTRLINVRMFGNAHVGDPWWTNLVMGGMPFPSGEVGIIEQVRARTNLPPSPLFNRWATMTTVSLVIGARMVESYVLSDLLERSQLRPPGGRFKCLNCGHDIEAGRAHKLNDRMFVAERQDLHVNMSSHRDVSDELRATLPIVTGLRSVVENRAHDDPYSSIYAVWIHLEGVKTRRRT